MMDLEGSESEYGDGDGSKTATPMAVTPQAVSPVDDGLGARDISDREHSEKASEHSEEEEGTVVECVSSVTVEKRTVIQVKYAGAAATEKKEGEESVDDMAASSIV
ncbi:hypothetical protein HK101_006967 [Irineochytrium annulatum]|nr:hypothetical protein HK101_006967 [Irineochytrium annulatum]